MQSAVLLPPGKGNLMASEIGHTDDAKSVKSS